MTVTSIVFHCSDKRRHILARISYDDTIFVPLCVLYVKLMSRARLTCKRKPRTVAEIEHDIRLNYRYYYRRRDSEWRNRLIVVLLYPSRTGGKKGGGQLPQKPYIWEKTTSWCDWYRTGVNHNHRRVKINQSNVDLHEQGIGPGCSEAAHGNIKRNLMEENQLKCSALFHHIIRASIWRPQFE